MKALSLTQPWATLIAIGAKKIETRGWWKNYRGWVAIHATKSIECLGQCLEEPYRSTLVAAGYTIVGQLPRSAIVALAHLSEVFRFTEGFDPGEPERSFGDFAAGRYGFRFDRVVKLQEPIPARGALGLWDWTAPDGFILPDVVRQEIL